MIADAATDAILIDTETGVSPADAEIAMLRAEVEDLKRSRDVTVELIAAQAHATTQIMAAMREIRDAYRSLVTGGAEPGGAHAESTV